MSGAIRSRARWVAAAAVLASGCGLLAACGGSAASGADAQSITLYNGQHVQTADNLISAFEKKTGITVNVRSDDEDTLADQIVTEGSHSPADVFFTENSPPLESLQAKGLLSKVDSSTLGHVPAKFSSPQGDWVGVSARVSVLIYNPSLISASKLPTKVSQLADSQYKGKLALAPQETDFQPIVTAYLRAYGKAATQRWLKAIQGNASGHIYPDNETIADEVNRGAVAFGIVNQYYWYRMRAEIGASATHAEITHFAAGDPGYVVDVSGAGILKSSTHQAAAQKFLAFIVSKQGQEIIGDPSKSISYEYPIGSGVTTQAPETPFSQLQPYPITIAELGDGSTAIALMRQAGLL
ncbi:MAG TPA: extracellular solute-binding protein [Streptosporangiaceae bacterium]|nr:extracellular solute-binding protein [Streptosporangiaceae bacterium]